MRQHGPEERRAASGVRRAEPGSARGEPAGQGARIALAEVGLPNLLVLGEGLRVVRERDRPRLHHVTAVGDVERHERVLLDEEDRRPLLVDLDDDLEDPLDEDRRQAHRRLVEEQELRLRHQRASDRAHLLLASGHRPCALVAALLQPREELEDPVERLPDPCPVFPLEGAHLEVLHHAHAREETPAFGRLADAHLDDRMRRVLRDVPALEADLPLARVVQAVDRPQGGRLARAVRPDERHDLAVVDVERHALDRMDRAVVGVDVLELEDLAALAVLDLLRLGHRLRHCCTAAEPR